MKRIIYFTLAFSSFSFVSCKKEYSCNCKYTTSQTQVDSEGEHQGTIVSVSTSSETIKDKEDKAKSKCEGSNGDAVYPTFTENGQTISTVNTDCKLN